MFVIKDCKSMYFVKVMQRTNMPKNVIKVSKVV